MDGIDGDQAVEINIAHNGQGNAPDQGPCEEHELKRLFSSFLGSRTKEINELQNSLKLEKERFNSAKQKWEQEQNEKLQAKDKEIKNLNLQMGILIQQHAEELLRLKQTSHENFTNYCNRLEEEQNKKLMAKDSEILELKDDIAKQHETDLRKSRESLEKIIALHNRNMEEQKKKLVAKDREILELRNEMRQHEVDVEKSRTYQENIIALQNKVKELGEERTKLQSKWMEAAIAMQRVTSAEQVHQERVRLAQQEVGQEKSLAEKCILTFELLLTDRNAQEVEEIESLVPNSSSVSDGSSQILGAAQNDDDNLQAEVVVPRKEREEADFHLFVHSDEELFAPEGDESASHVDRELEEEGVRKEEREEEEGALEEDMQSSYNEEIEEVVLVEDEMEVGDSGMSLTINSTDNNVGRRKIAMKHFSNKRKNYEKCEIVSSSYNGHHSHKFKHDTERRFECDLCGTKFCHPGSLSRHLRIQHNTENNFECEICGARYLNQACFYKHMRIHEKK